MRAQASGPDSFTGRYVLDSARSDRIDARVEATVKDMNFVKRPIARRRLLRVNRPATRFELRIVGDTGRIVLAGESPIPLMLGRGDQRWTNAEQETFAVAATTGTDAPRTLRVRFKADDGERVNLYTLSGDGSSLSLMVTVASPQLDTPLRYTLRYTRESAKPAP